MSTIMSTKNETATILFNDVYGNGHGREMTVIRFVSVLNISEVEAKELFNSIHKVQHLKHNADLIHSSKVQQLKQNMIENDPRGNETATKEQKHIWYRSYDRLEQLMSDEDFEDFLDTLD